jgi:hypothetical protein
LRKSFKIKGRKNRLKQVFDYFLNEKAYAGARRIPNHRLSFLVASVVLDGKPSFPNFRLE